MTTSTMPAHTEPRGAIESPRQDRPVMRPAANVYELEDAFVITMDLPGVDKERIEVEVEKGSLSIRADSAVSEPEDLRASWREYRHGRYARSFALGNSIDASAIDAQMTDGVLTVRLPKCVDAQPQRIEVH